MYKQLENALVMVAVEELRDINALLNYAYPSNKEEEEKFYQIHTRAKEKALRITQVLFPDVQADEYDLIEIAGVRMETLSTSWWEAIDKALDKL